MACFYPIEAYRGRHGGIVFSASASKNGLKFMLPCGRCIGCRQEKARQWQIRCWHEAMMHPKHMNSFVTLTYDNEHLPQDYSLSKREFQLFMKRLRNYRERKGLPRVRFFGCGEYGDTTNRPHYHVLLFGCRFDDQKLYSRGRYGDLYSSADLDAIWGMSERNLIGEISPKSAGYVARYSMKKITGEMAQGHYERIHPVTGEVFHVEPEFGLMSRKPGIGAAYYAKYGHEVRALDTIRFDGKDVKPPRYYDDKMSEEEKEVRSKNRLRKFRLFRKDNTPDRRRVREVIALRRYMDGRKRSI